MFKKTTESLHHHNFATVSQSHAVSANGSERNSLDDKSQCLKTAIKYSSDFRHLKNFFLNYLLKPT